ncbi:MAG: flavodoxin family protein [Muribaculaceae bacterium]|nr:flavodoxin family protein [Muribaculaceae bacterium]
MKALFINGSPRPNGCTKRGLQELEKVLKDEGIDVEWLEIGSKDIRGCISCYYCRTHNKCVFNDLVNESAPKLAECDALVVGTPVYYAGPNGQLHSFLDRLFFSTAACIDKTMKVGATVVSSRRAGSTSAFDDINKYFTISAMPIASSTYWNEVHGFTREDVEKDLEGLQTMRNLGRNLAFLLKAIKALKDKEGVPQQERGAWTNFIEG